MTGIVNGEGQVTIPKPIRDRHGIKPGTKAAFSLDKDGQAFIQAEDAGQLLTSRFELLRGTVVINALALPYARHGCLTASWSGSSKISSRRPCQSRPSIRPAGWYHPASGPS
jgi:antitoxin PrlF